MAAAAAPAAVESKEAAPDAGIDRENPEALCNWISSTRHVAGGVGQKEFFVNKVTGEEREIKPNLFMHGKAVGFSERSLYMWDLNSPFRLNVAWITTAQWFDNFILFLIVLNSIALAIPDFSIAFGVDLEYDLDFKDEAARKTWWESSYSVFPGGDSGGEADPDKSDWTNVTVVTEYFFTVAFALEALLKIIAMGFCVEDGAYLRDSWNVLDFVVVLSGGVAAIPGMPRISALRTIRVVRPLRSLSVLPSMRNLINTLLQSIPALMNVVLLLFFVFVIFGVLAIQLWGGIQNYRCRITRKPLQIPDHPLVVKCAENGVVQKMYCEAKGDAKDLELSFECDDYKDCFVKEHYALMGAVFGEDDQSAANEVAKRYVAAMVTRRFKHTQSTHAGAGTKGTWTELNYCGSTKAADEKVESMKWPSFYQGYFPDYIALDSKNTLDKAEKLSDKTGDDGPWTTERDCFWPIYMDGRVCSKEGVGLGGGLNECGRAELAFPAQGMWLAGDSKVTRAAEYLDDAEKGKLNAETDMCARSICAGSATNGANAAAKTAVCAEAARQGGDAAACTKDNTASKGTNGAGCTFKAADEATNNNKKSDNNKVSYWEGVRKTADTNQCYDIESYYAERRALNVMFVPTTCGSNYDHWGNPRFKREFVQDSGHRVEDLAFGFTRFNYIVPACQTIFQAITEEGWTDIMYQLMDADNYFFAAFYFVALIIFGSFICLNLTLAVLWNEFSEASDRFEAQEERAAAVRAQWTKGDGKKEETEDEKEKREEAEKKQAAADAENLLSWYYFGLRGSHAKSSNPIITSTYALVEHGYFEAFIVGCILLNTVTLSMDAYDQSHAEANFLEYVNFCLTLIFIVEMVLKLIGLGLREYLADSFNQFDGVIVIGSLIEMILLPPSFIQARDSASGGALSALRSFRLFRLFKLARSWKSLHHLLATMVKTLSDIANFALLLLLFIYIFALVAMQFFANQFRFDDDGYKIDLTIEDPAPVNAGGAWNKGVEVFGMKTNLWKDANTNRYLNPEYFAADVPRAHFDDVYWASTTIFQVLSGENWNTVMYDGWRSTSWLACLFFVVLIVMGIMIVLELFVAVLLGNFEGGDDDEEEEDAGGHGMIAGAHKMTEGTDAALKKKEDKMESLEDFSFIDRLYTWIMSAFTGEDAATAKVAPAGEAAAAKEEKTDDAAGGKKVKFEDGEGAEEIDLIPVDEKKVLKGNALFCLAPDNGLRVAVSKIVFHELFDQVILVLIILSSIMLAIETPLDDPDSQKAEIFGICDLIFTIAFIIEMALKHITLGVYYYWTDSWNVLDGVIVAISIIVMASKGNSSLSSLRALRTLRVLRPLRMINRAPGLKRVVNALLFSIPKIMDVLVVCALFFLIFAIVGINFLKGQLNMCAGGDITGAEEVWLGPDVLAWDNVPASDPTNLMDRQLNQKRLAGSFFAEECNLLPQWSCTEKAAVSVAEDKAACGAINAKAADGKAKCEAVKTKAGAAGACTYTYKVFDFSGKDGQFQYNWRAHTADELSAGGAFFAAWNGDNKKKVFENYDSADEWASGEIPYNTITDNNDVSCFCKKSKDGKYRMECETSKDACLALKASGREVAWEAVVFQSFDNLRLAMSCLFEISTTEGWVDVMYAAADATGLDMQPSRDTNNMIWVVFFVAFIICGSFFVLNLFVGVVCDTFNEMRERFGSDFLMTGSQKEWVQMRKRINKLGPYLKQHLLKNEPTDPFRKKFYDLAMHPYFDAGIMGCIIVNTIFMATRVYGHSASTEMMLTIINLMFAAIFTVEAIIKLIALDIRYFDDGWNIFDFTIVVATDVFIVVRYTTDLNLVSLATVMRTFRVLRIFRLIQSAKELRKLINTLIISLPQLANIAMLLVLCLFIFAVMGVQMFAKTALFDAYNEHANFQNFGTGILTLMRSTTGENWNGMMYNMAEQTDQCVNDPQHTVLRCGFEDAIDECLPLNGCGSNLSFVFWILFTMLVSFVVLNVFVAVILEAFENSNEEEEATLTEAQWQMFCRCWIEFIPPINSVNQIEDAFRIEMTSLLAFFKSLPYPMGFRQPSGRMASDKVLMDQLQELEIETVTFQKLDGLYAEFWAIAIACAKRVMVATSDRAAHEVYKELASAEHIERQASGRNFKKQSHKDAVVQLNAKQYFAALRIACAFRSHKFREKIAERVQQDMRKS